MKSFGLKNVLLPMLTTIFLAACQDSTPKQSADKAEVATFDGCYAIEQQSPAQIKISQENNQFVMQMKEQTGGWDTPESLQSLDKAKGWQFFSTNAIQLSSSDVMGVLARPDGVMAMAQLHEASVNTNPMLDSHYVVNLLGAVNTIYQVPCDDKPVNFSKQFHHDK